MAEHLPLPIIRERLEELATDLDREHLPELAARLRALSEATKRRPAVTRHSASSRTLTPQLAAQIRAYQHEHPERTQQEIANRFRVNPGRVSEALHGDV